MEVEKCILERRSIRKYKKEKPHKELILKILELAIWAPSAGNLQSWEIILIDNEKIKEKIYKASLEQPWVKEAPYLIVICSNWKRIAYYGERGIKIYTKMECGALIQNILLIAHNYGLGTCWVGAFYEEEIRKILKLPEHIEPLAIVCIGYPDETPTSWRYPLNKVLHYNVYWAKE